MHGLLGSASTMPRKISFDSDDASDIRLHYPETPLRVTYAARLLSLLGCQGDESSFYGALLWLRLCTIGSPQPEKSGWEEGGGGGGGVRGGAPPGAGRRVLLC